MLAQSFDNLQKDKANLTAVDMISTSLNNAESMAIQTMFDSLSISIPKTAKSTPGKAENKSFDKVALLQEYKIRFELVFDYVFLAVSYPHRFFFTSYLTNTYSRLASQSHS